MPLAVGKTFQMLTDGQAAVERGVDVVLGYFEPHARPDTIAQATGLEIIPHLKIEYRGKIFQELDTDAVLRRWKKLKAPILQRIAHGGGHRFWQTGGGYDHNLFNRSAVRAKIDYMHGNPVRRGLVLAATEYAWSSARWYAGLPDAKLPCGPLPW